jgi:hypothetical protein
MVHHDSLRAPIKYKCDMIINNITRAPNFFLKCAQNYTINVKKRPHNINDFDVIYEIVQYCTAFKEYGLETFRGFDRNKVNLALRYIVDRLHENRHFMLVVVAILHFTAEISRD